MGRLFVTNDSMVATIDLSSYTKLTVSIHLYWDSFTDNDDLAMEYTTNSNNQDAWVINPNESLSSDFGVFCLGASAANNGGHFTRPSADVWHRYMFTFDRTTGTAMATAAWVDGAIQTMTQDVALDTPDNFTSADLYFMSRGGSSLFGDGRMAEVAIYPGVIFGTPEAKALNIYSPLLVRPGDLEWYWPIFGKASPEPERMNKADATISGPVVTPHDRVIYPSGQELQFHPTVAAVSPILRPPYMLQSPHIRM